MKNRLFKEITKKHKATKTTDYSSCFVILSRILPVSAACYAAYPEPAKGLQVPARIEPEPMRRIPTGWIVNTPSGIALDVCQAGYSASKAALDKITIDLGSKVDGTDVMINLTDPGWCRTDLGGPQAPNAPESAIPGIVAGVFADDKKSGRYLGAQHFVGLSLEETVRKVEREFSSPYHRG